MKRLFRGEENRVVDQLSGGIEARRRQHRRLRRRRLPAQAASAAPRSIAGRAPLHIARGFALVGDDLYIASAWRKDSHIALYQRNGFNFRFKEVLATTEQVAAMVHPFDVELGDDGRIYVSSQDTNTVVSLEPETRKPAAVAAHLLKHYPDGKFLPGTLVASATGAFPSTATAHRSMCHRLSASRWCSTRAASHGTQYAASSCTGSDCMWRMKPGTQ